MQVCSWWDFRLWRMALPSLWHSAVEPVKAFLVIIYSSSLSPGSPPSTLFWLHWVHSHCMIMVGGTEFYWPQMHLPGHKREGGKQEEHQGLNMEKCQRWSVYIKCDCKNQTKLRKTKKSVKVTRSADTLSNGLMCKQLFARWELTFPQTCCKEKWEESRETKSEPGRCLFKTFKTTSHLARCWEGDASFDCGAGGAERQWRRSRKLIYRHSP